MKRVVKDRQRLWWGVNVDVAVFAAGVLVDVVRDSDCEKRRERCVSRSFSDVPLDLSGLGFVGA